jgi:hypothetical protein
MVRTLCILPLVAVAAYLAWYPPAAAGSAPTTEARSAMPLAAVSPSDASDAGWPLDAEADSKTDVGPAATIAARPKTSKTRPPKTPPVSAAETSSTVEDDRASGRARESASDSATIVNDTISQPIDRSIDRAADESDLDSNLDTDRDRDSIRDAAADDANQEADENSGEDTDARPTTAPVRRPLTSDQRALSTRVRRVLNTYYKRQLNSRDHNPWEMMHAIIAYGVHTKIHRGGPKAPTVNAVSYLCWNGTCHGLELLYLDKNRVNARKGPYVQGHYAQLLAILAQSRVPKDYPLRVGDRKFTIADLIETEKLTCDDGMELTFKLIAFSHYCDSDMTWHNDKGEEWDIPRLIKEELKAPILSNAACGGTHRLTALAYAVRNRAKQGHEIDGAWLRAQKYLNDYHRYNFSLQNSDGSFSTEWFRRREARDDLDRRLQTSGHILEWFVYSLPDEQLTDPRVVKAVKYVSGILAAQPSREWEIGPLGHAIHALAIYDQRVFKAAEEGALPEPVAERRPAVVAPRRHEEASHRKVAPQELEPREDVADGAPASTEREAEQQLAASSDEYQATAANSADAPDGSAHTEPAETALTAPVREQAAREARPSSAAVDARERAETANEAAELVSESPVMEEPLASDTSAVDTSASAPVANGKVGDDSPPEVPEVARRGLLRKPFARRPRRGETPPTSEQGPANQPPAVGLDPMQNQTPTDAATAVAESDGAARHEIENQPSADELGSGEFECAELPSEMPDAASSTLPIETPGIAEPSLSIDTDEPAPAVPSIPAATAQPAQTAQPTTSGEGPDLFGTSPIGVPRGEEASSTESEPGPAVGPALGAPTSIGDSFDKKRYATSGANVDPPPAPPEDEPLVTEPPVREPPTSKFPPRRRAITPPVVADEPAADESDSDEFRSDEDASAESTSPDDIDAYDVQPDDESMLPDGDPNASPEAGQGAGAPGSSRRPRAKSRYVRPLPEYSTYPGGQTPPPHAPRRPLSGGQSSRRNAAPPGGGNMMPPGRNNTAPSLRGSITPREGARMAPRELPPQGANGSRPSTNARPPAYRPPSNPRQSNSNRSMSSRGAGERPPGRSIWPWSEEDRGGQSGRGGEPSSNKRSGRGLFQGD